MVTKKEWNDLMWKQLMKPTLLIGGIPLGLAFFIGIILSYSKINQFNLAVLIMMSAFIWVLFVIIIGLGAGGLDFVRKYGYEDEATADNSDFKTASPKLKHS